MLVNAMSGFNILRPYASHIALVAKLESKYKKEMLSRLSDRCLCVFAQNRNVGRGARVNRKDVIWLSVRQ